MSTPQDADFNSTTAPVSAKETREKVTPYAFGVSDELLGQPLASPMRRLFAQCIDLFLIVLLSDANALFLGLFTAITFFKAGSHLANKEKRTFLRKFLRFVAACLLFGVTVLIVEAFNEESRDSDDTWSEEKAVSVGLSIAQIVAIKTCDNNPECIAQYAEELGKAAAEDGDLRTALETQLDVMIESEVVSAENVDVLKDSFYAGYNSIISTVSEETANSPENKGESVIDGDVEPENEQAPIGLGNANDTNKVTSIIAWVEGIISDLGLGFGWAVLYYSVFTAWWRGYTIGKRVLRIKVVKLDGSELNLWESFGRYGGYGAGIATGLLGFLQIFWDPNRQTIQDKIAETLVLYRPKGSMSISELVENTSTKRIEGH